MIIMSAKIDILYKLYRCLGCSIIDPTTACTLLSTMSFWTLIETINRYKAKNRLWLELQEWWRAKDAMLLGITNQDNHSTAIPFPHSRPLPVLTKQSGGLNEISLWTSISLAAALAFDDNTALIWDDPRAKVGRNKESPAPKQDYFSYYVKKRWRQNEPRPSGV